MTRWLNPALIALVMVAIVAACLLGSTPLPLPRVLAALAGQADVGDTLIVWSIRLPRALAAFAVGAALAMSGAALQGLLRNPLAEPGVLGVSAGASLFATVALYYGLVSGLAWGVPAASVVGALAATALIAAAAFRTRSMVTLLLIGIGISSFAGALMALLLSLAPNPFWLTDLMNWTLGTVANRSFVDIGFAAPFIGGGMALLFATRGGLSALTLGEEAAAAVGLNLVRQRLAVVLGAGLATGGAVALAGTVGFVGIVAPHLVRGLVRQDPGRSLLPAALLGGLFLVLADILVRVLPTDSELKLGVVAALVGAPAFVMIAARRRLSDG